MRQNDYFDRGSGSYPPDVCPEMAFYFDSDEVRDRMLCAHIVLEARIADAVVYLCDLLGVSLSELAKRTLYDVVRYKTAESPCLFISASFLHGEVNGLCCALRTISGTKYMGVDFTDPAWVEEHRSKP